MPAAYFSTLSLSFPHKHSLSCFSLFSVFSATDLDLFRQELRVSTFILHQETWASLWYRTKQLLLALCSCSYFLALASLQQVHPISFFSSKFWYFHCLCVFVEHGLSSFCFGFKTISIFLLVFISWCVDLRPLLKLELMLVKDSTFVVWIWWRKWGFLQM